MEPIALRVIERVSQNIFQLLQGYSNITKLNEEILHTTRNYSQMINALSNLQGTSNTAAGVLNSTLQVVQELLLIHNDSTSLPTSCKMLRRDNQTVYQVSISWQPLVETGHIKITAIWENCVV